MTQTNSSRRFSQWISVALLTTQVSLAVSAAAWAEDPFRTGGKARAISPEVSSAFKEFFCAGRYTDSRAKLEKALKASPQEPMVYALLASLAYQEGNLEEFARLGLQTQQVATALKATDPLRGNLYEGVGYGLQAANIVVKEGVVLGLPKALPTLNQVFGSIRAAQAIDAQDPELNLLNGYMDLLLTYRDKALDQFQRSAPAYMALRGQALAYRDLGKFPEALNAADKAIGSTACNNPELFYLKGQILAAQGQNAQSVPFFDQALNAAKQLPPTLVTQIKLERDRAAARATTTGSNPSPTP